MKNLVPNLASLVLAASFSITVAAHEMPAEPEPVIYTNTEETYFDADAGREAAPWLSVRVKGDKMTFVDAFGETLPAPENYEILETAVDRLVINLEERETTLRRARPVTCWAAVRKAEDKPDGSPDYIFERELKMHDQGGRLRVGGGDSGAPETILRMRAVTWPEGSKNRPSLVLYVHTADEPDSAVSYGWADENASRVGLNLRWMQASCTVDRA